MHVVVLTSIRESLAAGANIAEDTLSSILASLSGGKQSVEEAYDHGLKVASKSGYSASSEASKLSSSASVAGESAL